MNLLQKYLNSGRKVIITTTSSGKTFVHQEKLYRFCPFGYINSNPIIGMGSAVIEVADAQTGQVLLKNTVIHPEFEWYGYCMMLWLRFRSYGPSAFDWSDLLEAPKQFIDWMRLIFYHRPCAQLRRWRETPDYWDDDSG
ncbi:MAG: hypothetical protein Q8L11_05075 [Candidatus Moranbacteria bacterium]|nr:hypothetical protein [Candidatus Moranbacteria bacterium]